jgi:hypothetical protein
LLFSEEVWLDHFPSNMYIPIRNPHDESVRSGHGAIERIDVNNEQESRTEFSAADSALGYLYQCRVALVSALRRVRAGEEFLLHLETLDDVVFEHKGAPPDLLQTKHRRKRSANLTDASADLWKTIRIWCEGTSAGEILPLASLYLVTTSTAGDGSVASYLRTGGRDVQKAVERLRSTARSSTNQANQLAYSAFLGLSTAGQKQLLERVIVIDAAPNIVDLDAELRKEVRWAVDREHVEPFLRRLEGWWLQRAVGQLVSKSSLPVISNEFESQMDDLREQFKRDALPIDEDILAAEVDQSAYQDAVFVRQLQIINIGTRRIVAAIREYFRAFEQRSRWVREELLFVGELEKYERRLVEEWELVFERMNDELGPSETEEVKQKAAHAIYKWVEEKVIPIRPNVTEPFVTRGSYQLLSDRLRVGWHPEFMDRLRLLLDDRETAS